MACGAESIRGNPDARYDDGYAQSVDGSVDAVCEECEESPPIESSGPPTRYETVTVTGLIDTLIPAVDACYAVTSVSGTFENPPTTKIVRVSPDASTTLFAESLPTDRNYGPGTKLSDGGMALAYQSNDSFDGQNGQVHGIFVYDAEGNQLANHNLYAHGITGPSATLPHDSEILVLAHNGDSSEALVTFGDSALVAIEEPTNPNSTINMIVLPGFKNAGAMALAEGGLVIAAADSLERAGSPARFLVVDPDTLAIESVNDGLFLPQGVGVNGNAPVGPDGYVLFTGAAMDDSGVSLALIPPDGDGVLPLVLPDDMAETNVMTGIFAGQRMPTFVHGGSFTPSGGIVFSINRSVTNSAGAPETRAETYYYDSSSDGFETLESVPANYPVAPVQFGDGEYCSAASGTGLDEEGNFTSDITFWTVEK